MRNIGIDFKISIWKVVMVLKHIGTEKSFTEK